MSHDPVCRKTERTHSGNNKVTALNKLQAAALVFLFERLAFEDEINTLDFSLAGDFCGKYFGAFADIPNEQFEEVAKVAFTLPTYTDSVFLAVTHSKEQDVIRILANIEDFEREHSRELNLGEVVLLPKFQIEGDESIHAVLLLRTAIHKVLNTIPDRQIIGGREIKFALVVPLTKAESDYRNKFGHDALMDKLQDQKKDIYFY